MNAIFSTFTAADLRNFAAKKRSFISFESAESLEAKSRAGYVKIRKELKNEIRSTRGI